MEYNKKRFIRGVILFFIIIILNMELPYKDKSIIEYLFPLTQIGTDFLNLGIIVFLIVMIISYRDIITSKRFNASPVIVFLIIQFIIFPIINKNIDIIKSPIYYFGKEVKSIEVQSSQFRIYPDNNIIYVELNSLLKSYRNLDEGFDIYLELPDSIKNYFTTQTILIDNNIKMRLYQQRDKTTRVEVTLKEGYDIDDFIGYTYYYEDYKLILQGSNIRSEIVRNDLY